MGFPLSPLVRSCSTSFYFRSPFRNCDPQQRGVLGIKVIIFIISIVTLCEWVTDYIIIIINILALSSESSKPF